MKTWTITPLAPSRRLRPTSTTTVVVAVSAIFLRRCGARRCRSPWSETRNQAASSWSTKAKLSTTDKWIVRLNQAVLRYPQNELNERETPLPNKRQRRPPIDMIVQAPEASQGGHVILGANATGKSLLVAAITAGHHHDKFVLDPLSLQHSDNPPNVAHVSFESHQALLLEGGSAQAALTRRGHLTQAARFLAVRFGLYPLLTRPVSSLSTGEIRKVLLIRALAQRPRLLVLDNALDGLDVPTRIMVLNLISQTIRGFRADVLVQGIQVQSVAATRTQVLMATHREEEIVPEISTATICRAAAKATTELRQGRTGTELLLAAFGEGISDDVAPWDDPTLPNREEISAVWNATAATGPGRGTAPYPPLLQMGNEIICLENVTVRRGAENINLLSNLNWSVRQGERWLVAGGNGAGKSSLSKLLTTVESSTDSKNDHTGLISLSLPLNSLGWVSTELHMAKSHSMIPALDVLIGIDIHNGSKSPPDATIRMDVGVRIAKWLNLEDHQLSQPFANLSQGEQKLVLLANAIARRPVLLILDEPLQGLDRENRRLVLGLVERICRATLTSVVYVTHHFGETIPSLTHALHLKEGRCAYAGMISSYDPNL